MGIDLVIISNHAIDYTGFDFDRLGREVAARLNGALLPNPLFYWLSRLYWEAGPYRPVRADATSLLQPWQHSTDEYRRAEFYRQDQWTNGQLHFSGPFEWSLTVSPGKTDIDLLPFRYQGWTGPSEAAPDRPIRTAYRKALATLVRALGGNEVTYLADSSHPLSVFWEIDDYAALRQAMLTDLGPPLTRLAQMEAWQQEWKTGRADRAYWVDNFSDLDWMQQLTLTPELQQLRDGLPLAMPQAWPFGSQEPLPG